MKPIQLLLLLLLAPLAMKAQTRYTVSGTVKDASNGEELISASVVVKGTSTGTTSNTYGFYSLSLDAGKYTLVYSYIGYEPQTVEVDLTSNKTINIELKETVSEVAEVVITGEKADKNVSENKMSSVTLDVKTIRKVPVLLGEMDIIKVAQLLPGVQAAGDGSTLTIVRGGNIDHNLVVLDEAVVYNPSHVIGFFSVFNGDAIKDFEIYKGGTPAQFGGRLSSVMDVRMKEGNLKKYGVYGGIGVLSSRVTVEGPIKKDTGSFIVSGRRSYFDMFFPLSQQTKDAKAYFGDLNVKMNYALSDKDRLFVSFYTG
ncbi:MAG TPA: TonB-dependent receptor, partial [Bacteroidia bacterium]|nr:TonB-dependent receptor [Bacteroidia bacterium]